MMEQLVVATYERFLLGYRLPEELQEGCELRRSFTYAAHQGPVRCLAAGGPWVVSGGQDDQLHIYDVKRGKDLGFVMNPGDGAVPCVQLHTPPGAASPTHMLSGSDDGAVAIWNAGGGWEALKVMRGHKGAVRSLSVHPTGRLALSVGHDRALRMWNLAKGRCSFTARLDAEADHVGFSASGEAYALLCDRLVTLHSVAEQGSVTARLQHSRRVCATAQLPDGAGLLAGQEDGRLLLWDLRAPQRPAAEQAAHSARIRAIVPVTPGEGGGVPLHLATASSDGVVRVWDGRAFGGGGGGLRQLAQASTSGRVTGMVLSAPGRRAPALADAPGAGGAAAEDAGAAGAAQAVAGGDKPAAQKQKHKQPQQPAPQGQRQRLGAQASREQPPDKKAGKQPNKQQQRQLRQQQWQQRADDADVGFEVVPAQDAAGGGGGGSTPSGSGSEDDGAKAPPHRRRPPHQQQRRKPKHHQLEGEALVARVQTRIKKRPGKKHPGGGGGGGGGDGKKKR